MDQEQEKLHERMMDLFFQLAEWVGENIPDGPEKAKGVLKVLDAKHFFEDALAKRKPKGG